MDISKQLKNIRISLSEIDFALHEQKSWEMERTTYIIHHHVRNSNISDMSEVVGIFMGTYEEADILLERLRAADPESNLYGYWRTEPEVITPVVERDIIESFK